MAAGFCFGQMFELEPTTRQRIMRRLGFGATAGFIVLRMLNLYGDPVPWLQQKNVAFTIMSFLSCTKYPGSLDFVLMTLGPAFLALAYLDRHTPRINNPLVVFGKVPLFYFVVHFYLIHLLEAFMAWLRYGNSALLFVFNPPPSMGGPQRMYPPDFGYNLWVTYGIWVVVLACLYPLCRWYAYIKTIRRSRWLSYF
jgi:uncharacterized membrane protein